MALYPTIAANALFSTQVELERADRPFAVTLPTSMTASEVRVQFAVQSGGTFGDLFKSDGSGAPHVVYSGATGSYFAHGVVNHVPTPFVRLYSVTAQAAVRTFTINPVMR